MIVPIFRYFKALKEHTPIKGMEDSYARCRCVGGALNFVDSVVAEIIGNPSTNFDIICASSKVNLKCLVEEGTSLHISSLF
ncbi:hypothetical protein JG688_00016682 [Phytophthora aleatoria]|uniref:Uncharacterized protein n=1 Tax=Phytophthora aleatoria TaxID=2496075 RepID=A0A8J5IBX2_9STRA|nr:hypothetical protein JG688_00016682 [Phytophthora aleatoria]